MAISRYSSFVDELIKTTVALPASHCISVKLLLAVLFQKRDFCRLGSYYLVNEARVV